MVSIGVFGALQPVRARSKTSRDKSSFVPIPAVRVKILFFLFVPPSGFGKIYALWMIRLLNRIVRQGTVPCLTSKKHRLMTNSIKKTQFVKMHKFVSRFFFAESRRKMKKGYATLRPDRQADLAIKKKRHKRNFDLCGGRGGLRALHRASF